jgi:hypothetical protein
MESSLNISNWLVEELGGESQEDGMRSRPAESECALWPRIPGLELSRPAWLKPRGSSAVQRTLMMPN